MSFTEHALELSIMELFEQNGYIHRNGQDIHRDRSEVLDLPKLRGYLTARYASQNITDDEIDHIIITLKNISGTDYDENRIALDYIINGFTIRRTDPTKKDLFVNLIDFDTMDNNYFEIVNQVEIQGRELLRIPDGIVYVNGIPLVVLEFKSAIQENKTIEDAYKQLTVRYRRDIPELFKYNAFVVISDGVNNKIGSLFRSHE